MASNSPSWGRLAVPALFLALTLGPSACDNALVAPDDARTLAPDAMRAGRKAASRPFLVLAKELELTDELVAAVNRSGATVDRSWPQLGLLAVSAADPADFEARLRKVDGVLGTAPDLTLQWVDDPSPLETASIAVPGPAALSPPNTGDDDPFFDLLWGMTSVRATDAWEAGLRGAGVRVAILDSGIDGDHADLAPNLNTALSTSFDPDNGWDIEEWMPSKHGSHVAGIVAAADNGLGVIGVAPEAELVAVRVLDENGSGAFSWIISGIVYAGAIEADVINLSLSGAIPRSGIREGRGRPPVTANEIQMIVVAMQRAVNWARQRGATVVAAAGNDGSNFDRDRDLIRLPAQLRGVISVAATSPIGWANPDVFDGSFDHPTYYTNYGKTGVTFAAPGGSVEYYFRYDAPAAPSQCTLTTPALAITNPCYIFDMVMSSTYADSFGFQWFSWYQGTSMAAPHVSGVAALIIGANGGDMKPAQVEAALRAVADDLGKPGRDPYHGLGQVRTGH